jgi:hypothetical protein
MNHLVGRALSVAFVCVAAAAPLLAQTNPRYVQFSPGAVKGALYRPDSGPAPHVAILVIHRTSNFMGYLGCTELSKRGFLVLCMNPRSDNNEARVRWEDNALDVKSGVTFLRAQPGITKVLLWGFSGGGPTTTFYQAVAENGISYCQGARKLVECGKALAGLPPADGLILVDSHPGNAANALRRLNGAVTNDAAIVNEHQRPRIDPALDPFDPKNGYNPKGASTYSDDFRKRYFEAQASRMNRLIDLARAKLRDVERGEPYPDDDAFLVVKGDGAELMLLDPSIHHTTQRPQKLLKNDGTIVRQVVESVRRPQPALAQQNASFGEGTMFLTLRSFLSANAIRAGHSMDDIEHCSSNNSVPCAVQVISAPVLITAMGANNYIRFNETHFELARSKDKDFVVIEGANHSQTPCVPCETVPGQYSNTVKNFYDYVQRWIGERF